MQTKDLHLLIRIYDKIKMNNYTLNFYYFGKINFRRGSEDEKLKTL